MLGPDDPEAPEAMRQQLFFHHPLSPESWFLTPDGTRIYNAFDRFVRDLYWKYEFDDVITPTIYEAGAHDDTDLSHRIRTDRAIYGLKATNCP